MVYASSVVVCGYSIIPSGVDLVYFLEFAKDILRYRYQRLECGK